MHTGQGLFAMNFSVFQSTFLWGFRTTWKYFEDDRSILTNTNTEILSESGPPS